MARKGAATSLWTILGLIGVGFAGCSEAGKVPVSVDASATDRPRDDSPDRPADSGGDDLPSDSGSTLAPDLAPDSRPDLAVAYESNVAATLGGGSIFRGSATFRFPPLPAKLRVGGIRFLTDGDRPPGAFGGGGISVEVSTRRPYEPGTVRLAYEGLGSCDAQGPRPCWTGPDFDPPLLLETEVWITISRVGGEGGSFRLPIAAGTSPPVFESWGMGQVIWPGSDSRDTASWVQAPTALPWIFKLVGAP